MNLIAKAKELRASGMDVIGLARGEPDFDAPKVIREKAAKKFLKGNTTLCCGVTGHEK